MAVWFPNGFDRDSHAMHASFRRNRGRHRMLPPGVAIVDRSLLYDDTPFGIDPSDYMYYYLDGWRVAIPKWQSNIGSILIKLRHGGPAAIGYDTVGDTIMPADLDRGDRITLAEYQPPHKHY